MTEDMMEHQQTSGRVESYFLYCLQVICLLMTPILMNLYNKITAAEFTCPPWISFGAINLITCIFDPNPMILITVPEILVDEWFKKDYRPPIFDEIEDANLDDVEEVFKDSEEYHVTEKREEKPTSMNAFELISLSQGLNLGNLFDKQRFKRETKFTSKYPTNEMISKD